MSILAALAVGFALVATSSTVESRPLALVAGEHAVEHSTQHAAAGRQLLMSAPLRLSPGTPLMFSGSMTSPRECTPFD